MNISSLYCLVKKWCYQHWFFVCIGFITAIALLLRLYALDKIPAGLSWDEAAIGYNGHAIVRTRRDEWLQRLPLSFKSFGDYKAPLAIYVNGIFTYLFGLNAWAVRLPFVLAGISSIVGMIFLVKELLIWQKSSPQQKQVVMITALVSGLLLSLSPWHFHFSRAAFEAGMAANFIIWGILLWSAGFRTYPQTKRKWLAAISIWLGAASLGLSLYTYHSPKIVVPFILLSWLLIYGRRLGKRSFPLLISAAVIMLLVVRPLLVDSLWGPGAERAKQVSQSLSKLTPSQQISTVATAYLSHLSPSFLIGGKTTTLRHGDGQWGVLYLTDLLLIAGAVVLLISSWRKKIETTHFPAPLALFSLLWFLSGLLPGAITTDDFPHANRAFLALPAAVLLSSTTIWWVLRQLKPQQWPKLIAAKQVNTQVIWKSAIGVFILLHGMLALSYFQHYFSEYKKESAQAFFYGYQQAFEFVIPREESHDKILFTSQYGQPYIYALFFRKTNPIWYQGGSLIKYEFTDRISAADMARENTVIVATPKEIDPKFADQLVISPSGEVRFVLIDTAD